MTTLRPVPTPPSPGDVLRRLLTANHASRDNGGGRDDTRACEPPVGSAGSRLTVAQCRAAALVRHPDDWWCDPAWDRHGLSWWYPHVVALVRFTSTTGRRGAGGGVAVPVDLTAIDFLHGSYWASDQPANERTLNDPDNYRLGFVPTVLELEKSARRALRMKPRPRQRAEGSYDPAVPAALTWLAAHADQLVDETPMYAATVRTEVLRLLGRSAAMVLGNRFTATVNDCMYCYQPTVIADEDRAFCRNPDCRRPDGARRCWRLLEDPAGDVDWVEVDEPDIRGRGQVSDEQLSRWVDTA